jgi:hypothetical protein
MIKVWADLNSMKDGMVTKLNILSKRREEIVTKNKTVDNKLNITEMMINRGKFEIKK